jgi:hypothetical protein
MLKQLSTVQTFTFTLGLICIDARKDISVFKGKGKYIPVTGRGDP